MGNSEIPVRLSRITKEVTVWSLPQFLRVTSSGLRILLLLLIGPVLDDRILVYRRLKSPQHFDKFL